MNVLGTVKITLSYIPVGLRRSISEAGEVAVNFQPYFTAPWSTSPLDASTNGEINTSLLQACFPIVNGHYCDFER